MPTVIHRARRVRICWQHLRHLEITPIVNCHVGNRRNRQNPQGYRPQSWRALVAPIACSSHFHFPFFQMSIFQVDKKIPTLPHTPVTAQAITPSRKLIDIFPLVYFPLASARFFLSQPRSFQAAPCSTSASCAASIRSP